MAGRLDFYFFYGSIHSYLSVMRIGALASAAGLNIAKRAKRLALNAVVPALAVRPAASRSGKRKEKSGRGRKP